MDHNKAKQLIQEMLQNPLKFSKKGKAHRLLQEYFEGFPISTLRPLLHHNDVTVRRDSVWIASELGDKASDLIKDIIPLLNDPDPHIRYYALDVVMVCSFGDNVGDFIHVVAKLHDDDDFTRKRAMFLISNAGKLHLKVGSQLCDLLSVMNKLHKLGLSTLCKVDLLSISEVRAMIDDKEPLVRRYGAITAARLFNKYPDLIQYAISSVDTDIREFAQDFIDWKEAAKN